MCMPKLKNEGNLNIINLSDTRLIFLPLHFTGWTTFKTNYMTIRHFVNLLFLYMRLEGPRWVVLIVRESESTFWLKSISNVKVKKCYRVENLKKRLTQPMVVLILRKTLTRVNNNFQTILFINYSKSFMMDITQRAEMKTKT